MKQKKEYNLIKGGHIFVLFILMEVVNEVT